MLVLAAHFFSKYNYYYEHNYDHVRNFSWLTAFLKITQVMNKEWVYPVGIIVIITLLILSGVSVSFSKNNIKGAIITLFLAYSLTLYTLLMFKITGRNEIIRFGILHLIGWLKLIGAIIMIKPKPLLPIIAGSAIIISFIIWQIKPYVNIDFFFIGLGNSYAINEYGGEYFPFYRYAIYFIIGLIIGMFVYKERKTLLPDFKILKLTKPINFFGRHSFILYILHFIIYDLFFYVLRIILNSF